LIDAVFTTQPASQPANANGIHGPEMKQFSAAEAGEVEDVGDVAEVGATAVSGSIAPD
jgi:hypothetical protein